MNRRYLLSTSLLLLALALACSPSAREAEAGEIPSSRPEQVGLSQERLDRITQSMQNDVDRGHLPGSIGVIARRGRVAYWEAVGQADMEAGKPMADDTIFRIYSMTKPIVGVALMTLYEDGLFELSDPIKQHIPELGGLKVLEGDALVDSDREMTVQDLMRHTAGLTYGLFGESRVDTMYNDAGVLRDNESIAHFVTKLSTLPLKHQPGSAWEYSVSVDVQGRLIEVLSGTDLASFLSERLFDPLDMRDTAFTVPAEKKDRFVQMYSKTEGRDGLEPSPAGRSARYYDYDSKWYSGGGGLVSTTRDYLRFCQMLLNGGELGGVRILSRKTVDLMTRDHMRGVRRASRTLRPGYGFGLDFAVHIDRSRSGLNGSLGEYNWGGLAGTSFWIDPVEEMIGLYMIQMLPPRFGDSRTRFKTLAYSAIVD